MKTDITSRGSVYDHHHRAHHCDAGKGNRAVAQAVAGQIGFPRNLVSGKPYRGINVFLLHAMSYESARFG